MPLIDVVGHCPACQSQKIHVFSDTGMFKCLNRSCPEPGAVNLLLRLDEQLHFMKVHHDGSWTVRHPLIERIHPENLFSCEIGPGGAEPGFYGLNEDGTWTALEENPWPSSSG